MSEPYPIKESPDGQSFAPVIPKSDRSELWRAFSTLMVGAQGIPMMRSARGDLLRKLEQSLKGQ